MVHTIRKTSVTKSLVRKILEKPLDYDWSIQGLGMLRLYLDDERRLHIWDDRYQVQNVSRMHTHPWNFKSLVIAGEVNNIRYIENPQGTSYNRQSIFCGVGGGLVDESDVVNLIATQTETYTEQMAYEELAHEIHVLHPKRGTVTIIKRNYLDDADHAYVYWESGEWVSAEPRKATDTEVNAITLNSLNMWF